jgi:hypothetical protein
MMLGKDVQQVPEQLDRRWKVGRWLRWVHLHQPSSSDDRPAPAHHDGAEIRAGLSDPGVRVVESDRDVHERLLDDLFGFGSIPDERECETHHAGVLGAVQPDECLFRGTSLVARTSPVRCAHRNTRRHHWSSRLAA